MSNICIIGGGHSSGKLTQHLINGNFKGNIKIFSEEDSPPYERPPLSKEYLEGTKSIKDFELKINFEKEIQLFLNSRIENINLENKTIVDKNNTKYEFDKIVFANGTSTRKINFREREGICYLRNIKDSIIIKDKLLNSKNIVIAGAGYIGLEVASTIRKKYPSKNITIIESSENILNRNANDNLRNYIKNMHIENNVNLILNSKIEIINGLKKIESLVLNNSTELTCDLLIVGIGVKPNIEIIQETSIFNESGILINEHCETKIKDIYAIGDITYFNSKYFKDYVREESWNNAEKQSYVLAQNLLGIKKSYNEIPWFWTNQYDNNIQILGDIMNYDNYAQKIYDSKKITQVFFKDQKLKGIFTVNNGRDISMAKQMIKDDKKIDFNNIDTNNLDLKSLR